MNEKKISEKVSDFLKMHMMEVVIAAACAVYILAGIAVIGRTGKTIFEIMASGLLAFIFGTVISKIFSKKGIINGEQNERFRLTLAEFSKTVAIALNGIEQLPNYCKELTEQKREKVLSSILNQVGLKYKDFTEGKYDDTSAMNKSERFAVLRAKRTRIKELTKIDMLSEQGVMDMNTGYFGGRSKQEFSVKNDTKIASSKLLFAIIFGYFGLSFVTDVNWINLLWSAIQVVIFLVTGVLQYITSYNFIVDEYRTRILNKKNILVDFNKRYNLNGSEKQTELLQQNNETNENTENKQNSENKEIRENE